MSLERSHLYSRRANRWILATLAIFAAGVLTCSLSVWLAWAGAAWPAIGASVAAVLIFSAIGPCSRRGRYWVRRELQELAHLLRER